MKWEGGDAVAGFLPRIPALCRHAHVENASSTSEIWLRKENTMSHTSGMASVSSMKDCSMSFDTSRGAQEKSWHRILHIEITILVLRFLVEISHAMLAAEV